MLRTKKLVIWSLGLMMLAVSATTLAAKKPNILVLWGDDVGVWNTSAYNRGGMGYKTPHIDSIATEGVRYLQICMHNNPARQVVRRSSSESSHSERGY